MYVWEDGEALQADFQVDCSTMELGSYWNGVKQACYTYTEPTSPGIFSVICGNNVGDIYACLQESSLFGNVDSAFINWATS